MLSWLHSKWCQDINVLMFCVMTIIKFNPIRQLIERTRTQNVVLKSPKQFRLKTVLENLMVVLW